MCGGLTANVRVGSPVVPYQLYCFSCHLVMSVMKHKGADIRKEMNISKESKEVRLKVDQKRSVKIVSNDSELGKGDVIFKE